MDENETEEEENLSTQLSEKFDNNATPKSIKSSIESKLSSSKSDNEEHVLNPTQYEQITQLLREKRQDEISIDDFELFVLTNIRTAQASNVSDRGL